jgi:hypothetical protein
MRFLLGWTVKLGFLAIAYLAISGNLQIQLPQNVLGFEVPAQAHQWADRSNQLSDIANMTQAGLKQLSDGLK